ncbi:hypothetical protein K438DRAFT_1969791 [Mycena galopus ATCC 62051]|nr:hypothetical protein K438DRAFT_1969791 [Mycena galopus ATCC 62051]
MLDGPRVSFIPQITSSLASAIDLYPSFVNFPLLLLTTVALDIATPPRVTLEEANCYAGLPSCPALATRTGITPVLRIVGQHQIQAIWEDDLAFKVHAILDAHKLHWTSMDVVRIAYADEKSCGDVVLWIGFKPGSLSYEDGMDVALECARLLREHAIEDLSVEIRESEVIHLAGLKLLGPLKFPQLNYSRYAIVDVREPFTSMLAATESGCSWSPRHVVLPLDETSNDLFERRKSAPESEESQPRHDVLLLSDESFWRHLTSVEDGAFYAELSTHWASKESRILGHVIFTAPLAVGAGAGTEQCAQDITVIEVDADKIDARTFTGNALDLGSKIPPAHLVPMMRPNPKNKQFEYPIDRGLRISLRGIILQG